VDGIESTVLSFGGLPRLRGTAGAYSSSLLSAAAMVAIFLALAVVVAFLAVLPPIVIEMKRGAQK
jgi:hypothetical protein